MTKNSESNFHVVVLSGIDDLHKNQVTPEILCDKTFQEINNLRFFPTQAILFFARFPPRSDLHRVNLKVSSYNNLVSQKLKEMENVSIIETLPLELKLFYKDGLHLSNLGLTHMWYNFYFPDVKRSRVSKRNSNRKHRTISYDDR